MNPAAKATTGPLHAVPCAHCGAAMDMRGLQEQNLVENGQHVVCDACNRPSLIVAVQQTTIIRVRQA
jgi:hypothetical protein